MLSELLPLAAILAGVSAQSSVVTTGGPVTDTVVIMDYGGSGTVPSVTTETNTRTPPYTISVPTATVTADPPDVNPDAPTLTELASSTDELSTLLSLLQQDRFSIVLRKFGNYGASIFAPTNQAFEDFLATDDGQRFQGDDEYAISLLLYHAVLGRILYDGLDAEGFLASQWYSSVDYSDDGELTSPWVGFYTQDGNPMVASGYLNVANVLQPDIPFRNGHLHICDSVLTLPPTLQNALINGGFTSLLGAIQASSLDLATLEDLRIPTVFAPTNEAFANIGSALDDLSPDDIATILMYHVSNVITPFAWRFEDGQQVDVLAEPDVRITIREGDDEPLIFANAARVVQPNIALQEGGVVHGIDQVLNPNQVAVPAEGVTSGVVMFEGAESVDNPPLTSGQPTPTTMIALPGATNESDSGSDSDSDSEDSDTPASQSSGLPQQSSEGAAMPMMTAAPVFGMLMAGGAVMAAF